MIFRIISNYFHLWVIRLIKFSWLRGSAYSRRCGRLIDEIQYFLLAWEKLDLMDLMKMDFFTLISSYRRDETMLYFPKGTVTTKTLFLRAY